MKKIINRILKVIGIVIAVILFICVLFFIYHRVTCIDEEKNHPSQFSFVEVGGKRISMQIQGEGEHTIVLLPGLGTTSPIYDFAPLADELAKNNRVITYEPFGYGYSDITDKSRTIENECEELKQALDASGVEGPYIFMAHSVYGLDSIYFANKHPEYVEAVVGIDCTMPAMLSYFGAEVPADMPMAMDLMRITGLTRLLQMMDENQFVSDNSSNLYSEENLQEQRIISARIEANKNVIEQYNDLDNKIKATFDLKYTDSMPILFFTTNDADKEQRDDGKTSKSLYETYITNPDIQSVITYDASHYMHWTKAKEMSDDVNDFVKEVFNDRNK